jgi:hypothetical protein
MNRRRAILSLAAFCFSVAVLAQPTSGGAPALAIKGYAVSYAVSGIREGVASIARYDGRYLFSSAKNRDLFARADATCPSSTAFARPGCRWPDGRGRPTAFLCATASCIFSAAKGWTGSRMTLRSSSGRSKRTAK